MTKRKGNYVPGPGRDSFSKKHGEKAIPFKVNLTEPQYNHLKSQATKERITMAEYLRNLIAKDMAQDGPPPAIP